MLFVFYKWNFNRWDVNKFIIAKTLTRISEAEMYGLAPIDWLAVRVSTE